VQLPGREESLPDHAVSESGEHDRCDASDRAPDTRPNFVSARDLTPLCTGAKKSDRCSFKFRYWSSLSL
jgi:hypothetical protein